MANCNRTSRAAAGDAPKRVPGFPSDVSKSQQRVREWIINTEDNVTSSGVSDVDDTACSSRTGHTILNSRAPQEFDSSMLSQDSWDRFQTVPRDDEWTDGGFTTFVRCVKAVCVFLMFAVVLCAGVTNKLALLTLTSSVVKTGERGGEDPAPTMLLLAVCFPYLCHLLTYSTRSLFGASHWPSLRMTVAVLLCELCHTAGVCLLLFRVLPRVDLMRALMILTSVYVIPCLLQTITTASDRLTSGFRRFSMTCIAAITLLVQVGSVGLATYQGFLYNLTETDRLAKVAKEAAPDRRGLGVQRSPPTPGQEVVVELPLALGLISLGLWENFIDGDFSMCGHTVKVWLWKARLNLVRQRLYILVSVWKITTTVLFAVFLLPSFTFTLTFPSDVIAAVASSSNADDVGLHLQMYGPLYAMLVSATLCSYVSGLACKLCVQTLGFALPLTLVIPVSAVVVMMECEYHFLHLHPSFFTWVCPAAPHPLTSFTSLHLALLAVTWLSQLVLTRHVWTTTCGRMEKIQKLFVTPMRCAVLTEQTLLARRRIAYRRPLSQGVDGEGTLFSEDTSLSKTENTPLVYACATMWHETHDEMAQLMKSIFRLDIDRSARFIAQKYYNVKDPDYYDLEAHILFDDAIETSGGGEYFPNQFVSSFMSCLDDAVSAVHERPTGLGDPVKTTTPYGGRLTWVLPGGTPLVVHLKDKNKIRHKKRWSQVMYMYYLLGFKILADSEEIPEDEPPFDSVSKQTAQIPRPRTATPAKLTRSELRRRRTRAHFARSVIFNHVSEEVQIQAENTYILALDGDVDFKPDAVRLLLDRMKKNKKVGAACGRIHPTGSGPMVWYQKFEYAIGHWLQKATEHVFGCVLCAPGCFTLFRGSALMDDNVVRTYATRSTQATHYLQYDQGEDRWLSTLLLLQGYRIDYAAAADALTHAPETFSEFFNQRRRWGPSTLVNLVDVIGQWRSAVHLNDNLSTIYMLYQAMMLVSALLGPATVLLLMAGSFRVVFKIGVVGSYVLALMLPVAYLAVCLWCKPAFQVRTGALLSALYAIVMTIVLVGTVGTAISGSVTSPNVLFLVTVILVFSISGLLHPRELYCILPGLLYLIMIPAGYLVLTIYFLTNLHVVSWGTRETPAPHSPGGQTADSANQPRKQASKAGGLLDWLGVNRLVKEVGKLLKQVQQTLFHKEQQERARRDHGSSSRSRTDELLEELILELRRSRLGETASPQQGSPQADPSAGDTSGAGPVPGHAATGAHGVATHESEERAEGDLSQAEEERLFTIRHEGQQVETGNHRASAEIRQHPIPDDDIATSWLMSDVCGEGPVTDLHPRESAFWRQMICTYLYPLTEDKAHLDKMNSDLKDLRNHVVAGFTMLSAIWVALTMQLEVLQDDLQAYLFIHIARFDQGPPLLFQPLGFCFLATFAFILIMQFLGMFCHRWGTLLHTLAITDIGLGRRNAETRKVRDAIHQAVELQKLRNIELEPEPDYDEDDEPHGNYGGVQWDNHHSAFNPVYVPEPAHIHTQSRPQLAGPTSPDHDAVSLASEANNDSLAARVGWPGWQPHGTLARAGHVARASQWDQGKGGPLGNFTLLRAFEKRYRNALGVRANLLPSASAVFGEDPRSSERQPNDDGNPA